MSTRTILRVLLVLGATSVALLAQESQPTSNPSEKQTFEALVSFVAFGDWGVRDEHRPAEVAVRDAVKAVAKLKKLDLVILLGDNFYKQGIKAPDDAMVGARFERIYTAADFPMPFLVTLGNHDYRGNVQAEVDIGKRDPRWRLEFPPKVAAFGGRADRPLVDFFNVDTERLCKKKAYRDEDIPKLAAALKASKARWKIAYGHRPLFSDGAHGDNQTTIDALQSLFDDEKVNLYLSGHDHHMQVIQDRAGTGDDKTLYCIAGSGGEVSKKGKPGKGSLFMRQENGFMLIELAKETARVSYWNIHAERIFEADIGRRSPSRSAMVNRTFTPPPPVPNLFDDEETEDDG